MCGITGYYSLKNKLSEDHLRKMTASLTHRGPDSEGYFSDGVISLGVRRLRVIGLTSKSDQPIHSSDGRYVAVYNGEVYNFHEIANELKSKNLNNKSLLNFNSDSDVILESFAQWGTSFVQKLNGMFVIAIYDTLEKSLYIFQYRLGIKPLYYSWDGGIFAFASELKALLEIPSIKKEIDYHSIYQYLHLGFIAAPKSIYKGICKMMPGTFITVHNNTLSHETYWSLESCINNEVIKNETHALIELSSLIKSSVLYQLNSDVPSGILLSGGIDSTLLAAKASNLASVKVNTYSIGFEDKEFSELHYARNISDYLGTNHHEFIVSNQNSLDIANEIPEVFDEPFADASAIPMLLLARMAKQTSTVVLSGEGADELFMGYGSYRWAKRLNNPFIRIAKKPIAAILSHMGGRYERAAKLFEFENDYTLPYHIFSQEQYFFSGRELISTFLTKDMQLFSNENSNSFPAEHMQVKRKLSAAELQVMFDLKQYLPNDLLVQADRTSMHYSLEMRVPFLDHRLVEFALNLSPSLKLKGKTSKYLLKKLLNQDVPPHLTDRPKQGFSVPLQKWLQKDWKNMIDETLNETNIEKFKVVQYKSTKKLIEDFRSGKTTLYNRIWQLIVLHKWLIKNYS